MDTPELPPVAPGAYAAPPRSGTTVGEQRGGELGGFSIRFPEIVIGLPRLEWRGATRHRRASHMRLDEATAPFTANPHYEAALVQRALQMQQLRALQEEVDRRERAAQQEQAKEERVAQEEDELQRLRESERQLREQLAQMQRQLQQIHSQLTCPPRQQCPPTPRAVPLEELPSPRPTPPPVPEPNCVDYQRGSDRLPVSQLAHYHAPATTAPCSYQDSRPFTTAAEMDSFRSQDSREGMLGNGWQNNQFVPRPPFAAPMSARSQYLDQSAENQDLFDKQHVPVRLPPTTR